jgi:hypothetical protein
MGGRGAIMGHFLNWSQKSQAKIGMFTGGTAFNSPHRRDFRRLVLAMLD